eukprot:1269454-Pleurochrysis_carterae.AAC.2
MYPLKLTICNYDNSDPDIIYATALRRLIPGDQADDYVAHASWLSSQFDGLAVNKVVWVEINDGMHAAVIQVRVTDPRATSRYGRMDIRLTTATRQRMLEGLCPTWPPEALPDELRSANCRRLEEIGGMATVVFHRICPPYPSLHSPLPIDLSFDLAVSWLPAAIQTQARTRDVLCEYKVESESNTQCCALFMPNSSRAQSIRSTHTSLFSHMLSSISWRRGTVAISSASRRSSANAPWAPEVARCNHEEVEAVLALFMMLRPSAECYSLSYTSTAEPATE